MRRSLWLLILIAAAAPARAIIAPKGGGPLPRAYFAARESDPNAFRMSAAWIGRTERIRREGAGYSHAAWVPGETGTGAPPVSGVFAFPVLLGEFANRPSTFTPSLLDQELFTGPWGTGTLAAYFYEVSYGALTVTGVVSNWVSVLENDSYYEGASNGLLPGDAKTGEFLKALLDANDAAIDFGEFDNDGPDGVPNSGDDDGIADLVVFVHSEAGGECGAPSANIWSHAWLYRGWPNSAGVAYATNDPCANGGTIRVDDYAILSGLSCETGMIEIGGFCHEVAHALGLPDLFDANGGSSGAGDWDLMGHGNWNSPASPAHLSAWSRAALGWVTPTVVAWQGSVRSIPQIETSPTCFILPFTDDRFRRMSDCAIAGSYSLRCGLDAAEAAARGWTGGSGYGNDWDESVRHDFVFNGALPVALSFDYTHDLEPAADSAAVYLVTGGSRVALAHYTGLGSGTETVDLSPYLGGLAPPASYSIEFRVTSDAAWSDEDGKHLTACGAFVIDEVSVTGGGESYTTGFETSVDGWYQNPAQNPPTEYWLVENRQPVGFDSELHNSGLLVWHVDEEVIRSSLGNTGGSGNSTVRGLVLEEADAVGELLHDPGTTGNTGDAGDPYPGTSGNVSFGTATTPESESNTGRPTQIEISSIGPSGPTMTAFMRAGDPAPVLTNVAPNIVNNDLTSVEIGVAGDRLRSGATLRFARSGESDITPTSVRWRDAGAVAGGYNLYSKKGGSWDVIIENPDGQTAVLPGALNLVQIVAAQLRSAHIGLANDGTVEAVFELFGLEPDETLSLSRALGPAGPWERLPLVAETIGENTYRFIDGAVEPGEVYYYRLEAWSASGDMRDLYRAEVTTPSAVFGLEPCSPNPFNPSTTFSFSLPVGSDVKLVVYDVSGRVVRTLLSETLPAGRHRREWDGRDDAGARVSTGVYICRLEAGSRRASIKALLLK